MQPLEVTQKRRSALNGRDFSFVYDCGSLCPLSRSACSRPHFAHVKVLRRGAHMQTRKCATPATTTNAAATTAAHTHVHD